MKAFSKFNIISGVRDSDNFFIVNLLSGHADILTPAEAERIRRIRQEKENPDDNAFVGELIRKGYITEDEDERKRFNEKYLDFLDSRESDEVQLFFITNYTCNFACSYCYQDQYTNPARELTPEVIDSFFRHVKSEFAGRKKYITVFGGEPLLPGEKQKALIEYILLKSTEAGIDLCFVTNGYNLKEYAGLLSPGRIREVQVTLDGTKEIHNSRRYLKGGGPTFERIVEGIDACIENKIPVNLRVVTDRDNIEDLPRLAAFAEEKGWAGNPNFKTQIGRNYELHHCQPSAGKLFDRISLYEKMSEIIRAHPHILKFHKPAYSVTKFLAENGSLPDPLFDSCPACKTEWAFDYTGRIYPCTATAGKSDECIGTFYPELTLSTDKTGEWESRDVTTIQECRNCNLQLACGGGCGSVAKNRTGKICSPDCRPVRELMEIGFSSYFSH